MEKHYNQSVEGDTYKKWEASGAFSPSSQGEPFTIIMPPPNANDPLHVGHAMFVSIQDIFIRYARMSGKSALWLPGTDHAGIETQYVFEKKLAKEGLSRFNFDRESLFDKISNYVKENSQTAVGQMQKLGASADWSRFKFTLDPDVVDFVYDTFIKLNNDKMIYREEKLVNYCTKCGTGYSDLETEHVENESALYYIKYGPLELATTRPETKFADTAVAVNPNDTRYKHLVGQEIEVSGLNGNFRLKVIADDYVDPNFGTGVVKITPYHDHNDFEVWTRHKNEMPPPVVVIGFDGKLTEVAGKYAGMKVNIAREAVVKDLDEAGLLSKQTKHKNTISVCYRCKTTLEPLPLPQFFISVKTLTKGALKALDRHETKIHGVGREKILRNWLENLKDWNISRQIVWGIRLPVWYEVSKNPTALVSFITKDKERVTGKLSELLEKYSLLEISQGLQTITATKDASFVVSKTKPEGDYLQETDTFDTWFSSGQWPVVTLKAREGDFERYYPTTILETAYEILPFWVMRMMMLGIYLTGKSPFKHVYLHGLIRDSQGRKMSKSVGNVVDPISLTEKYGADALRMALVMGSTPGQDKNVGEDAIRGMRNFSNKIWNATRFVLEFKGEGQTNPDLESELNSWIVETTKWLEKIRPGQAAEAIYGFFWHRFCDYWIEEAKKGNVGRAQMETTLKSLLALLHPFAPFTTEASWREIEPESLLINMPWPKKKA